MTPEELIETPTRPLNYEVFGSASYDDYLEISAPASAPVIAPTALADNAERDSIRDSLFTSNYANQILAADREQDSLLAAETAAQAFANYEAGLSQTFISEAVEAERRAYREEEGAFGGFLAGNIREFLLEELETKDAFPNLFEVMIVDTEDRDSSMTAYSRLRCSKFNLSGDTLNFKRDEITKHFSLEKYQRTDSVTIDWAEDSDFRVRNFHQAWLASFYDRENDVFISGITGKFKVFVITVQKFQGRTLSKIGDLILTGVIPKKIPDLNLDWATSGRISYSLEYNFKTWEWRPASR